LHFISLEIARAIADGALTDAAKRGISKAAVVVTDLGGDIRVALRADAAGSFGVDIARGKAQTALGLNASSLKLAQVFGAAPASTTAINAVTGGRFVPIGGGVLVINSQGHVIGAAGVSGGAPETDDAIVTQAVRAAGLDVLP
jgi:uncharacterized protein GlcG (DUF336 family)